MDFGKINIDIHSSDPIINIAGWLIKILKDAALLTL
jgi:hypothetical protein